MRALCCWPGIRIIGRGMARDMVLSTLSRTLPILVIATADRLAGRAECQCWLPRHLITIIASILNILTDWHAMPLDCEKLRAIHLVFPNLGLYMPHYHRQLQATSIITSHAGRQETNIILTSK